MDTPVIVFTLGGPIIGHSIETEEGTALSKPRCIQVIPDGRGRAQMGITDVLGSPEILYLPPGLCWYVPTDKAILNAYIQSTTGIQIAGTLPPTQPRTN
jgi:hypothetical protein